MPETLWLPGSSILPQAWSSVAWAAGCRGPTSLSVLATGDLAHITSNEQRTTPKRWNTGPCAGQDWDAGEPHPQTSPRSLQTPAASFFQEPLWPPPLGSRVRLVPLNADTGSPVPDSVSSAVKLHLSPTNQVNPLICRASGDF